MATIDAIRFKKLETTSEMISAAKYYMGVPDGKYFRSEDFDESVVNAQKAYITLNTLMGGKNAEYERFVEGKKLLDELITPLGVQKMVQLFEDLYCLGKIHKAKDRIETVRACRSTEISESGFVETFTSTTKLSLNEIMELGYGDKVNLALCYYRIYEGSVIVDMEALGDDYMKPEEREVLVLMKNRIKVTPLGKCPRHKGIDGNPALMYIIDVFPPECSNKYDSVELLEKTVYDEYTIDSVRRLFRDLNNTEGEFPGKPPWYDRWKMFFQSLVWARLNEIDREYI